jgi:hypothetical protein
MRPNYTRGCDKDGHTPPFLKDIDLMSALAMWGRGRIIRQKHLKMPANVEGVPAVVIPCVQGCAWILGCCRIWRFPDGKKIYMKEALEQVVELFRAKDWKFEVDEESDVVRTGIEGDNGHWQVVAIASDDDDAVVMLSLFPQKCPAHRRRPCAELLTRINFGMMMGCFEMDYESGKIHFKTTLPFTRGDLNAALLDNVVMLNLARMDRFLPAIMSVIYAEISPGQALAAATRQTKDELRSRRMPPTETQDTVRQRFMNN